VEAVGAIELRGTAGAEDLIRFQSFHTMRSRWLRIPAAVVALIVLLWLLIVFLTSGTEEQKRNGVANITPMIFLLGYSALFVVVVPRFAAKLQVRQQPYLTEETRYVFTPEKVTAEAVSTSFSLAWSMIRDVRETRSLFLLYHSPRAAVLIPKRYFADAQAMDQWRQLVIQSAPKHRIEKPGLIGRWF
jgi:hypothetical protein